MRLKQVIGICALFTSSIHANAIDDQLRNFIGDDVGKLDSVLATTPSFNELDKTDFKTKQKVIKYLLAKGYESNLVLDFLD